MEKDIIEVIKSLGEFMSIGGAEASKIAQASEILGVEFAEDFKKYTQTFGAIRIDDIDLCGVVDYDAISTVALTQEMRDFSDFPMDCYVIESLGIDDIVCVQKSDGKVYQYAPDSELELIADSLGEYLLSENDVRNERSNYWKESAKDL